VTNRQSKPTGSVPSWGRIAYDTTWFVIVALTTIWVFWGAETDREYAGAVLGVIASLVIGLQAFQAAIARSVAAMAAQRETLAEAIEEAGYTVEDGRAWLEREPGSPFYKPGPY
jgi:hypothetical protein